MPANPLIPEGGMNTSDIKVGRLLEIRVAAGYRSADDVNALFHEIALLTSRLAATRAVAVVDWRLCPVMSGEAAELLLEKMTKNNPRTERSAALAARDSPTAMLQFLRLVRESNHPKRRLFYKEAEVVAWLDEVLTPAESARLREFLREPYEKKSTG
jgi:hypothetical protein